MSAKPCSRDAEAATAGLRIHGRQKPPMRFCSALGAAPSLCRGHALEKVLTAFLANILQLGGRTLILVDTSASMDDEFFWGKGLMRWGVVALFDIALGRWRASVHAVSFSSVRYCIGDARGVKTGLPPDAWRVAPWRRQEVAGRRLVPRRRRRCARAPQGVQGPRPRHHRRR
ncbi:hypothetical protein [Streptomyces sp. NPDC127066]|uniref:hypothetical protein n=1 Tax=Streptomyces sp. NPDC127066 TaxID=3347125 RepID=UPI003659B5AA